MTTALRARVLSIALRGAIPAAGPSLQADCRRWNTPLASFPPGQGTEPLRYQLIRSYPHDRFSLGRDSVTGVAVFAIKVPLHIGHYTAYYRLSEEELATFLASDQEVTWFADGVERGLQEARHMTAPLSIDAAAEPDTGAAQGTQQHTFALVGMGMEYLLHLSKSPPYSLCRHPLTLEPVFEIPVSSGAVDYEEYYRINEAELALLITHPPIAAAFAQCCGRHEMDDRLIVKPGTRRGSY